MSAQMFFAPPFGWPTNAVEVTRTITPGLGNTPGQTSVTLTAADRWALVAFDGAAGRRVSFDEDLTGLHATQLLGPDGVVLGTPGGFGFLEPVMLPVTGTYVLQTRATGAGPWSSRMRLWDVPEDVSGLIAPGGAAVSFTTQSPGQNAQFSFAALAGQRVAMKMTGPLTASAAKTLLAPDGTPVVTWWNSFGDTVALTQAGTYRLVVDPVVLNFGAGAITLYDVPPDATGTIVPGGAPVPVATTVAGQNARLTFAGNAGQRVSVRKASSSYPFYTYVSLLAPDGAAVVQPNGADFVEPATLPATGTYTLLLDPYDIGTGGVTLTLYDVPPDVTVGTSIGAAAVSLTTTVPGQNGRATFSGTAGQTCRAELRQLLRALRRTVIALRRSAGATADEN